MVLSVGLVSACVLYKNRPGAQTRLQKLQKKLKQKPISQKTLYSYPVKKLFSIVMILCFMGGMLLFLAEYKKEVDVTHKGFVSEISYQQQKTHYLFPYRPLGLMEHEHRGQSTHKSEELLTQINKLQQYNRVQKTVNWLLVFFMIPLMTLVCSLNFQRIKIRVKCISQANDISGHIQKQRFSLLSGWTTFNKIVCNSSDILCIELCGQARFSNTNYYYAIKKIAKQQPELQLNKHGQASVNVHSVNHQSSTSRIDEQIIIQKGNIYEARETLIYICHVLKKEINLGIKNGPVKDGKSNKSNKHKSNINKNKNKQQ